MKFLCKAYQTGILDTTIEENEFTNIVLSTMCNWLQIIKKSNYQILISADLAGLRWCTEIIYVIIEKSITKWTAKTYGERVNILKQLLDIVNLCIFIIFTNFLGLNIVNEGEYKKDKQKPSSKYRILFSIILMFTIKFRYNTKSK